MDEVKPETNDDKSNEISVTIQRTRKRKYPSKSQIRKRRKIEARYKAQRPTSSDEYVSPARTPPPKINFIRRTSSNSSESSPLRPMLSRINVKPDSLSTESSITQIQSPDPDQFYSQVIQSANDKLSDFELDKSTIFIKLLSIANSKMNETLQNGGEDLFVKIWKFNKFRLKPLGYGFGQCFYHKSELPINDKKIDDEFRGTVIQRDGNWCCIYTDCGCKRSKWRTKRKALKHLYRNFASFVCSGCGYYMSMRGKAKSHHVSECDYFKDNGLEDIFIGRKKRLTKIVKEASQCPVESSSDDDYDLDFQDETSLAEFMHSLVEMGKKQKLIPESTKTEDLLDILKTEEIFVLNSYNVITKNLPWKTNADLRIEPTSGLFKVYINKTQAFQIIEINEANPISIWDMNDFIKLSYFEDKNFKYNCRYPTCPCNGKFQSYNFTDFRLHVMLKNFALICCGCFTAFTDQRLLERHFNTDCHLPIEFHIDEMKQDYLRKYREELLLAQG